MSRHNPPAKEFVSLECECGKTVSQTLGHYDRVRCGRCGRCYWTLRPKRDGGLVLFPWPGIHNLQRVA